MLLKPLVRPLFVRKKDYLHYFKETVGTYDISAPGSSIAGDRNKEKGKKSV